MKNTPAVGARIRAIRKEKEVTLIDLAEKSGVQQATLSRIENGLMRGTVDSHRRISESLGISLAELYSNIDARLTEVSHSEKKARQPHSKKNNQVAYEVLTHEGSKKKLLPVVISLHQGAETDRERHDRGVDKFLWVLEGKVEAKIEKETIALSKGDTLYFDASLLHSLKALAGSPARVLAVTSPPTL